MAKTDLTAQRVRELLDYDPETGRLRWKVKPNKNTAAGGLTGTGKSRYGYLRVGVDDGVYQAHRVVWLYVHGSWPEGQIDHINGDRADNRIANLRDVPQSTNMQNIRAARCDSKCGLLGVSTNGKKWRSRIVIDGVATHLGTFETQELAHAAYIEAKRRVHVGCTI